VLHRGQWATLSNKPESALTLELERSKNQKQVTAVFRHQKRASDPITDASEPPCGCWELNSGPLEEQSVLLTTFDSDSPSRAKTVNHVVVVIETPEIFTILESTAKDEATLNMWNDQKVSGWRFDV